jgi:hypothetical protein
MGVMTVQLACALRQKLTNLDPETKAEFEGAPDDGGGDFHRGITLVK